MKAVPFVVIIAVLLVVRIVRYRRRGGRTVTSTAHGPSAARQYFETTFGDVGLVAAREVRERTRGRVYRVGTLLMLAVVAAAIVIPTLNKKAATSSAVGVVGNLAPPSRAAVVSAASGLNLTVHLVTESDLASAETGLRSGQVDLVVDGNRIIVNQAVSASDTSTIAQFAQNVSDGLSTIATIAAAHLSPAQTSVLAHPVAVPIIGLTAATTKSAARGTSIIGLILLFVLLSQYSAWILLGVAEEKSSRVVEVLLATVRPLHLLAGKVIGIGTAALAQASAIVIVALVLAKAVGSNILQGSAPLELASSLLWLVLGYAFYCWVYAAAGSLAERQDQLQSLTFPLSVPMLVGYIVSITAASTGNASLFFKVLAYLPPTAPFAMPVLVGLRQATWWEFVASIVISVASTVAVARFAAGIYRRAILRTGRRVKLREVLRATS
jgi:ABC-2 type transport system permease protein